MPYCFYQFESSVNTEVKFELDYALSVANTQEALTDAEFTDVITCFENKKGNIILLQTNNFELS